MKTRTWSKEFGVDTQQYTAWPRQLAPHNTAQDSETHTPGLKTDDTVKPHMYSTVKPRLIQAWK